MENLNLEKIILPNRDGAYLYLLQLNEGSNLYHLVCDDKHKYILEYACITLFEDNITIQAFDPSGGPYLNVGYKVGDNRIIKAIIPIEDNIIYMIID